MIINCIIIEDEPLALDRAKEFVQKISFLKLLQTFDNGLDAISFLKREPVDLIFLDIQMDEFSGIHLLESLIQRPAVIIISAFNEYAVKGFEFNVTDYLLKPYTFERFMQAAIKVYDHIKSSKKDFRGFIFIKTEYRLEKVFLENILFIEGMRVTNEVPKTEAGLLFDAIMKKYRGKVVFVDFWATWCAPCLAGIEQMKPLKEEMADKDVVFVYITYPGSPKNTWDNMIPGIKGEHYRVSEEEWRSISNLFGITGIPHYTLVDKSGVVVNRHLMQRSNEFVKLEISKYLVKPLKKSAPATLPGRFFFLL